MAGILHEFVQNTKILASQVNENFDVVQGDIEELGNGLNTKFSSEITKAKEDLSSDIEVVQKSLSSSQTKITNLEKRAYIKSFYVSGTSWYRVWSDGWIEQGGRSGRSGYAVIPVTFLKPFTSTNYSVIVTNTNIENAPTKSGNDNNDTVGSFTKTGFSLITDSNFATQWYAFGK